MAKKHQTIFAGLILIVLAFIAVQVKRKKYMQSSLVLFLVFTIGICYGLVPDRGTPKTKPKANSVYEFQIDTSRAIGAVRILNEHQLPIGKVIWANPKEVNCSFHFSPKNLSSVVDSLRETQPLLLNTTASYIDNIMAPVGFTWMKGTAVNPLLNSQWDGLVVINGGNLQVSLLTNENYFSDFACFARLSSTIINSHSDAFQVPLIVYNDSMLIDQNKVGYHMRENRFLLKIATPGNKEFYMLADIEKYNFLINNTYALYQNLKSQDYYIQFMVLLDVGANNLLQVYNADQTPNNNFRSTLPVDKATNFLAWSVLTNETYSVDP